MTGQKTFKGWAVTDADKWTDFSLVEYPSKIWEETDVEIAITHCGVCGSDVHTISSGWGAIQVPLIVGHEIVGKAVRVGSEVKGIKIGDRVGIGAQINSCFAPDCTSCQSGYENYCPKWVDTYGDKYPNGVRTQGGYSTGIIANSHFVFPIPEGVESKDAASMLCAGITVFSPLLHSGVGPGSKVGIIGIGGLGHYAVLFAKALGAEVTAFSHSSSKQNDVSQMGADHYIATSSPSFASEPKLKRKFDVIISTQDVVEGFPIAEYLSLLGVHGKFILVGLPDKPMPEVSAFSFLKNGCSISGSHIGSRKEILEMLRLAEEKGIKPWVEEMPMKKVKEAIDGVRNGRPRYRYVLTQDIEE